MPTIVNQPSLTAEQREKISRFLKILPHLELSDKGLQNVAKKFGVTPDVIRQLAEDLKK